MMLSSDQNADPNRLSETAQKMLVLRDEVFAEWEARLRTTVKESASLPHPILINTFPCMYNDLAEAITPGYPSASGGGMNTIASEHGGERARLTDYNPQAIIAEYQLLRWTILDTLNVHGIRLNHDEFSAFNAWLDRSIQEAVSAFALAQSALRERFVIALTHDLRNPLQIIGSAAELLLRANDPAQIRQLATRIIDNNKRVDRMIQELLDTAVFQSGERLRLHFSHFDMMELVQEVRDQSATLHGSRFEIMGESVKGWWGRDALKRAIENLVGNAVKYGAPATPIRIGIACEYERVQVNVHNEGEPIPPEQLESVFQVFRRAEAVKGGRVQGWGIGLPIVRSVAESHGGSVGLDSSAERGTTFSIDIPIDARPYQSAPTLGGAA